MTSLRTPDGGRLSHILPLLLLTLLLPLLTHATTNQTLYQTGFEPLAFTPGSPIRGQDNWEMFHNGEAISVSTTNARTGSQCLRMDGALLEQTGPNNSAAFCFSRVLLDNPALTPPIVELTAYVRLDGPQTGADGAATNDLMSANFAAVADLGGGAAPRPLGTFLVSSAGRIFTWGSRPEDRYKYSAPMTFGAYHKLVLRVDFLARTVRYFANDVELGSAPFDSAITSDRLAGGYLVMSGPVEALTTPYHYDPADYTAYFDDYSIASVPLSPVNAVVEFASTNILTDEFMASVRLSVTRRGFTNAALRVTVRTTNGTALAGEDYEAVSTFVTFAAGETNKVVEVPLRDDYWAEPDKAFAAYIVGLPPGVTSSEPVAQVIIRDDERPGSIDYSWASDLGLSPLDSSQSMFVSPIIQPDGKILVAIIRDSATFARIFQRVVRINSDGMLDPTFTPINVNFGNGINFFLMPDGKIVIAEDSTPDISTNKRLRRFHSDGTPDASLTARVECPTPGPWVVGLPTGKMLLLGSVRYTGAANRVNGTAVANLVRLNHDGSRDGTFTAPAGLEFYTWQSRIPVEVLPNGKILVGTDSTRPVYRLNENGSIDSGFAVTTATLAPELAPQPLVTDLLVQGDGKILAVGFFDTFNGRTQNGIVRLHPNGTVDGTYRSGSGLGAGGLIESLDPLPDGRVMAAGFATAYDGEKVNGSFVLNSDGTLFPAFAPALIQNRTSILPEPEPAPVSAVVDGQPIFGSRFGLGRLRMNLPSRIVSTSRDTNGATHLIANALTDRRYTLQSSETLTNWTDLTTQTATTNRIDFTDAPTNAPARRFYRVKQD